MIGGVVSTATYSGIGLQPDGLSSAAAGALAGKAHEAMIASAAPQLRNPLMTLADGAPEKMIWTTALPLCMCARANSRRRQRTGQSRELKASFKNLASRNPATPSCRSRIGRISRR